MFEQFLRDNFEIIEDEEEYVKVTENPVRYTKMNTLIDIFGDAENINYDELIAKVGNTGLGVVIKDWKDKGIIS